MCMQFVDLQVDGLASALILPLHPCMAANKLDMCGLGHHDHLSIAEAMYNVAICMAGWNIRAD